MRIGELAKKANCSVETIRYYEKEGLMLAPERQENNYRDYQQTHLQRLQFIRNCRGLDLNHDEIRELLALMAPTQSKCRSVHHVLEEHISHVKTRIKALMVLEKQLLKLHTFCENHREDDSQKDMCGILQGLSELEYDEITADLHTHNRLNYSHK